VRDAERSRTELHARQTARREREADDKARLAAARPRLVQGTGGGLVAGGGTGAAPVLLPLASQGDAQPASPPRVRPVLRLIRGGLAE
jgi:predicted lipid-binding transport protein (Tim44 family)